MKSFVTYSKRVRASFRLAQTLFYAGRYLGFRSLPVSDLSRICLAAAILNLVVNLRRDIGDSSNGNYATIKARTIFGEAQRDLFVRLSPSIRSR